MQPQSAHSPMRQPLGWAGVLNHCEVRTPSSQARRSTSATSRQCHTQPGTENSTMAVKQTQVPGVCVQHAKARASTLIAIARTSSLCSRSKNRNSPCTSVRVTPSASATGQVAQGNQSTQMRRAQRLCLTRSSNKQQDTAGLQPRSSHRNTRRKLAKAVAARTTGTIGKCAARAGLRFR